MLTEKAKIFYYLFGGIMEFIDRLKFKQEIGIYKITNLVNNKVYI